MNKAYKRINWEDYPSMETPLNEQNLNKADGALDEIDNRVISLDTTKATKTEVSMLFKEVAFNEQTGIITFTRKNGATVTIDTPMEKIQTGIYYNPDTEKLVLPLIDGTSMEVDLSRLMKFDEFIDSDTIAFSVKPNGTVTAIVKEGSIQEKHLQPNYLAEIKVEVAKAETAATSAESSKTAAASSASTASTKASEAAASATNAATSATTATQKATEAGTSATNAENSATSAATSASTATNKANAATTSATNAANSATTATNKANAASTSATNAASSATNAENYAKQAQSYAVGTGNARPSESTDNSKYFYEQSKEIYENFNAAGNVTGVKGNAESAYRTGNVNLTADNVGAISVKQLTNENLDDIKTPNLYYAAESNSVGGKPSGIDSFGLVALKIAGTWITQILYAGDGKRYTRRFNGGTSTWTAWTEEAQDDSSRPVSSAQMTELNKKLSLSGGKMTGPLNISEKIPVTFEEPDVNYKYKMFCSSNGFILRSYHTSGKYANVLTSNSILIEGEDELNLTANFHGTADFAKKLGTETVGNSKHPVYLRFGKPEACTFESNTHAANVYMNTDSGNMYYSTASSRRFKNSILPLTEESISAEKLYDIDVVQYKYNTNYVLDPTDSRYDTLVPGLIAEDVYDKYPIAADYHINDDGEKVVDDWNFRYIIPGMLKLIQDQKKKIDVIPDMLKLIQDQQKEIDELKKKLPSIL